MSGGGFYKFPCRNKYTYNCPNWVWVNNSACAACVADGREDTTDPTTSRRAVQTSRFSEETENSDTIWLDPEQGPSKTGSEEEGEIWIGNSERVVLGHALWF
ncbi:MAG: hypothetical protein M4579_001135 [Chaenotheca gracillima]|nr:MAG: hypothetical protein M4579_001135 [Chaenotheca gracillima]